MSRARIHARGTVRRVAAIALTVGVLGAGSCRLVGTAQPLSPPSGEASAAAGNESAPERPGSPPPARRFPEVRALWVVRTTMASPEAILEMVEAAERGGINTLLVQVRGRGDAYYASLAEPRSESLADQPASFDPPRMVIEEAHARGIAIHAWTNTHVVTTLTDLPAAPSHIVNEAPALLAVPRALATRLYGVEADDPAYVATLLEWIRTNRQRVEGLYSSPVRDEVHDRLVRIWTDLVEQYPLDGIHFDYVRYPSRDFDYSRGALEAFRRWAVGRIEPARAAELDRAAVSDPLAWAEGLPDSWDAFRRDRLTEWVARGYREIKRRRPDMVVSSAVVPDREEAREQRFQDWPTWLDRGIVDVVVPMAYAADESRYRDQIAAALDAAREPSRLWAGVGVHLTTFEGTLARIGMAREIGTGGIALFSYDWIRDEGRDPPGSSLLEGLRRQAFR